MIIPIPSIVYQGIGSSMIIAYNEYFFHNHFHLNTLTFALDENEELKYIRINQNKNINLFSYNVPKRMDANYEQNVTNLIYEISVQYNVNVILLKSSFLNKFFNISLCVLGAIELHESQDFFVTICENIGANFLRKNVPVITNTLINGEILFRLNDELLKINSFIIAISSHHLKYINYDTKNNSKYSYINLSIALSTCEVFNKIYSSKFKASDYKLIDFNDIKMRQGVYISPLPNISEICFDKPYNYITKIKNCHFYVDQSGTYKSNNFLVNWFHSHTKKLKRKNIVNICILDSNPKIDLIKSMLPITTLDLDQLYVLDYQNKKSRTYDELMFCFDNIHGDFLNSRYDCPLYKTIYDILIAIYHTEDLKDIRKKSMLSLLENYKINEVIKDKLSNIILPDNVPNIIIDDLKSILGWINKNSNNNNLEYHILCTGSKEIVTDIMNLIDKNEI